MKKPAQHPDDADGEVVRLEKIAQQMSLMISDLEARMKRKNKALEGLMAENEALKQELGSRKPARPSHTPTPRETAAATISRWKTQANKR